MNRDDAHALLMAIRQTHENTVRELNLRHVLKIAEKIRLTLGGGGRIYVCGCGGSAADAQHFVAELVGRYVKERRGYPAMALTTDSSILTAIGNDYGFPEIFARQIRAHVYPNDIVIMISTSGQSTIILNALKAAKMSGAITVLLTGLRGMTLATECDHAVVVPSEITARIQEVHELTLHMICELLDATEPDPQDIPF